MSIPLIDWKEIERCGWLHCVCLINTHRLICNMTYFGPWPEVIFWPWPFKFKLSFESSLREKHDDAVADFCYLYWFKSYSWKNISPVTVFFTIFDLWRLNCWHVVTCGRAYQKRSSKAIDWYHLRSSSFHSSWQWHVFWKKYNNIYQTLTFDDLRWPKYCSERKKEWNTFKRTYWELLIFFYHVFLTLLVF